MVFALSIRLVFESLIFLVNFKKNLCVVGEVKVRYRRTPLFIGRESTGVNG